MDPDEQVGDDALFREQLAAARTLARRRRSWQCAPPYVKAVARFDTAIAQAFRRFLVCCVVALPSAVLVPMASRSDDVILLEASLQLACISVGVIVFMLYGPVVELRESWRVMRVLAQRLADEGDIAVDPRAPLWLALVEAIAPYRAVLATTIVQSQQRKTGAFVARRFRMRMVSAAAVEIGAAEAFAKQLSARGNVGAGWLSEEERDEAAAYVARLAEVTRTLVVLV